MSIEALGREGQEVGFPGSNVCKNPFWLINIGKRLSDMAESVCGKSDLGGDLWNIIYKKCPRGGQNAIE